MLPILTALLAIGAPAAGDNGKKVEYQVSSL
jgi:hypothetical protein